MLWWLFLEEGQMKSLELDIHSQLVPLMDKEELQLQNIQDFCQSFALQLEYILEQVH